MKSINSILIFCLLLSVASSLGTAASPLLGNAFPSDDYHQPSTTKKKTPLKERKLPPEYWTNWTRPYFCQRSNATCWPTAKETDELYEELKRLTPPTVDMSFEWKGFPEPQPTAVPAGSANGQPLYGLGANGNKIKQLYVVDEAKANATCFSTNGEYSSNGSASTTCNAAVRNYEFYGWNPAFIVFAVVEEQVRVALQFAADHDLCIAVVNTGHEYVNRHSCPNGMMIRVTMMQSREFIPDWPNWAPGAFKVGPGNTFSSLHHFAKQHHRELPSGWCSTVGITGWTVGGGYGPLAPSMGLGVDNSLEFELLQIHPDPDRPGKKIVKKIIANATSNEDLLWALKGGGGNSWGVITSITTRAHWVPEGGFSTFNITFQGSYCPQSNATVCGVDCLNRTIHRYGQWQAGLSTKFTAQLVGSFNGYSPYGMFPGDVFKNLTTPGPVGEENLCRMTWGFNVLVIYTGNTTDLEFQLTTEALFLLAFQSKDHVPVVYIKNYAYFYDYMIGVAPLHWWIYPDQPSHPGKQFPDSFDEALAPLDVVQSGEWANEYFKEVVNCAQPGQFVINNTRIPGNSVDCFILSTVYQALTGSPNASRPTNVSVSPGFRSGLLNHLALNYSYQKETDSIYTLTQWSYFLESSFYRPAWPSHYWTAETYNKLTLIKKKYDPTTSFWCHHCIGDNPTDPLGWTPPY